MAVGRFFNSYLVEKMDLKWFFLGGGLLWRGQPVPLRSAPPQRSLLSSVSRQWVLELPDSGPTILACAGNHFPQGGASMFSLLAAVGNFGGVVGPLLIGLVAERWNLKAGMATLILAPLLAALLLLIFHARSRQPNIK